MKGVLVGQLGSFILGIKTLHVPVPLHILYSDSPFGSVTDLSTSPWPRKNTKIDYEQWALKEYCSADP